MLLERIAVKASDKPEYDWESYYGWLYGELAGTEVAELEFWTCRSCHSMNVTCLPARYKKCSECNLIHLIPHRR